MAEPGQPGPCELAQHHHNMKECSVVLERLTGDGDARTGLEARVVVRECRVVLERMDETPASTDTKEKETEEGETEDEEVPRGRGRPRLRPRALRPVQLIKKATNESSITLRKRNVAEMGRLRYSGRYPLRQKGQKHVNQSAVVMEVTRRSCWRRGRTRSKRPPPSSAAAGVSVRTGETERAAASGGAEQAEQPGQGDKVGPHPAPATPSRRLLCFRITIEAMVRGNGAAVGFGALFADYEKAVLRSWLDLSEGAAATYLRLLGLPGPWVRGATLAATCPPVREHFTVLEKAGFISTAISHCELRDVLALLRMDELEQITIAMGAATQKRTKLAMFRALTRLHASGPQQAWLLQERVCNVLGGCARVRAVPRELVERALLAVSAWLPVPRDGNRLRAVRTLLLQDCAALLVPEGLPSAGLGPSQSMFTTRQELVQWEAVARGRASLGKAIASDKSVEVLSLSADLLDDFRKHLESNATTPASRAIGGAMVEALDTASEALGREVDVDAAAVTILRALLVQRVHGQERRAAWAGRLAALLQTRLLDHQGAAELLLRELEDEGHRGAHRSRLVERARTVLRGTQCVRAVRDETRAQLQALLGDKPTDAEFRMVTIQATACPESAPGMKRVYVAKTRGEGQATKTYLSVEELAMLHFSDEYPRGVDDEGETLLSLAVLALWGAVYDAEVSGVWGTPLQDRPLDWGTDSFWVARHLGMEQRLQTMLRRAQDAGEEDASRALAADLVRAREARQGTPCLVRWDLLQGLDIEELLKCLTVKLFVAICRRLFLDFCSNRQGFPDLLLWNPEIGTSLFVEVKGPRDSLSAHQVKWLEFLRSHEAQVAVAQVRTN